MSGSVSRPTGLSYSPAFLAHDTGPGHPERPDRLRWITDHLRRTGLMDRLVPIEPTPAPRAWIETVHDSAYIDRVEAACRRGDLLIDSMDTAISPASLRSSRRSLRLVKVWLPVRVMFQLPR